MLFSDFIDNFSFTKLLSLRVRTMKIVRITKDNTEPSNLTGSDFEIYVDDLWNRIGKKLKQRGKISADVNKAIRSVRAKK